MLKLFNHCFRKSSGRLRNDFLAGRLFLVLLSFGSLASIALELFAQGSAVPNLIPSRQRSFGIPFEVKPDGSVDPPKEIELLVSKDRGGRWHSVGRLGIDGKQFSYRAEDDGEHWFAFRTITLSGSIKQSTLGPQIRVLVDATPPQIDVQLKQHTTGQIRVDWKVVEKNLKNGYPQFSISPKPFEGERNWTPLGFDGRNQKTGNSQIEGSFLFWPENGISEFDLRMIALDGAENRTEKIESLKIVPVRRESGQVLNDPSDFVTKTMPERGGADRKAEAGSATQPKEPKTDLSRESLSSQALLQEMSPDSPLKMPGETNRTEPSEKTAAEQADSKNEQKSETLKPDGPAQFGRLFDETLEASKTLIAEDNDALYVRRPSASGLPVVPPKPMRTLKKKKAEVPFPVLSAEKSVVLSEKYQPPPMLGSPTGQELVVESEEKKNDPEQEQSDALNRELFSKLDRFFDGKLSVELDESEKKAKPKTGELSKKPQKRSSDRPAPDLNGPVLPIEKSQGEPSLATESSETPQPAPAAARPQISRQQTTATIKTLPPVDDETPAQKTVQSGVAVGNKSQQPPLPSNAIVDAPKNRPQVSETKSSPSAEKESNDKPGYIAGVSLNTAEKQPQIIVKWNPGGPAWHGVQVDVLRGATLQGPWLPIATNLPNNGEYWWYVSVDDMQPFHLMVRLRTLSGIVGGNATRQPIRLDPTMFRRPGS